MSLQQWARTHFAEDTALHDAAARLEAALDGAERRFGEVETANHQLRQQLGYAWRELKATLQELEPLLAEEERA